MKIIKFLSKLINVSLIILLCFMIFTVVAAKASGGEPTVFGYELKTVLSGSMEPGIQTGSIIAVKPVTQTEAATFQKGDVITFKTSDNKLITHRIVKVTKSGSNVLYTTKGDNNDAADLEPVLSQNVVAEYTGQTIPYIGYFLNYATSKMGTVLLLIIPGAILLVYSAYTIWKALKEMDENKPASNVH